MDQQNPFQINNPNNKINRGKYNSKEFNNKHYYSTFEERYFLVMKSSGVLIIDNYYCAFYSGCKVLEMGLFYNYFSTNKRVISKYNHKDLNIKHSSLFFNEPHLLGISSLVELIIDIC